MGKGAYPWPDDSATRNDLAAIGKAISNTPEAIGRAARGAYNTIGAGTNMALNTVPKAFGNAILAPVANTASALGAGVRSGYTGERYVPNTYEGKGFEDMRGAKQVNAVKPIAIPPAIATAPTPTPTPISTPISTPATGAPAETKRGSPVTVSNADWNRFSNNWNGYGPAPTPTINVSKGANGVMEFSGRNVTGPVTYSSPWSSGQGGSGAGGYVFRGDGGVSGSGYGNRVPLASQIEATAAELDSPDLMTRNRALNRMSALTKATGALDSRYGADTNMAIAGMTTQGAMDRTMADINAQAGDRAASVRYKNALAKSTDNPMAQALGMQKLFGEETNNRATLLLEWNKAIEERLKNAQINNPTLDFSKPETLPDSIRLDAAQYDRNKSNLQQLLGNWGVERKADGGMIGAMGPQENPVVGLYGRYVRAATMSGIKPVPMEQFTQLLASTRQQLAQAPGQASPGMMTANPGTGQSMGYAEGGAINVDGRQVLGPGNGKSDSIPAVVDGKRKAALSTGEFVFPVEAVQFFGLQRLNKMVEQARQGLAGDTEMEEEEEDEYADGGFVKWLAGKLYGNTEEKQPQTAVQPPQRPSPEMLGSGMAKNAGTAIQGRQQQIEEQMRRQGY